MIVESDLERSASMLSLSPACQRDESHRTAPRLASDRTRDVVTRHLRHTDVEQHSLRTFFLGELNGRATVVGGEHLVARSLEQERQAVCAILAIVGDENPERRMRGWLRLFDD